MNTSINIDNYESFYLDYLEGNLDEADTAALMAFLEEHPDLVLEDDALAYLPEAEFVALDAQLKSGLKFPDTEQKIGLNNIEIFLIASVEKQLSPEKSNELRAFLEDNPFYAEELTLYQRSRLQADLSIVFPEKRSMKKGGFIVPMYARFAAAAASVVIAISIINWGGGDNPVQIASAEKHGKTQIELKDVEMKHSKGSGEDGNTIYVDVNPGKITSSGSGNTNLASVAPPTNTNISNPRPERVARLKYKGVKTVNTNRPIFLGPETAHHTPLAPQPDHRMEGSYAMVDMKNPIQPITNRISEFIKRDVDFRTSKAAKKKSGGFYIKIGKFELSRKMYDNTSVAANH